MFGHHSLSETSFGTDSIDLFFNTTGLAGTGTTFSSDITVNASSNLSILGIYQNTGSSVVLGNDGLEFTIAKAQDAISNAKTLFGDAFDEATANSKLNTSLSRDGILYQGESTDSFLEAVLAGRSTAALFDERNSFSITLSLQATSEIGRVLVWGNVEISQDPSYTANTSNQNANYSQVQPSQTPSYSEVEPSQTPSHTEIKPTQTPTWNT